MVKRITRFAFNGIITILFVLFLAAMFLLIQGRLNPDQIPSVFGYHPLTVLSNSMQPEFSAGDMVLAKNVNPAEVEVGDVITYNDPEGNIVTHRVIEITTENDAPVFHTQGDNNNTADDYTVSGSELIGEVNTTLPYGGYVVQFLSGPVGVLLFIILPVCALIGITVYERLGKDNEAESEEEKKSRQTV
ncbi:Signal peptidase I Serine peptidase. MEROPS family S26B [Alteribacillus persepolensis]|uniref:Signal peptidase I n=1 Tax=Alteribacillus persepolensis TaxID=568899 RepID=A0A1G8JRF0_9BACI|nr:signal peptidase I [Alteribacillus persepolensis]SDI33755.1 Signal peptidase I Serine peptidase. MEROPS family S26B [Alteribacillus persepolensis]